MASIPRTAVTICELQTMLPRALQTTASHARGQQRCNDRFMHSLSPSVFLSVCLSLFLSHNLATGNCAPWTSRSPCRCHLSQSPTCQQRRRRRRRSRRASSSSGGSETCRTCGRGWRRGRPRPAGTRWPPARPAGAGRTFRRPTGFPGQSESSRV